MGTAWKKHRRGLGTCTGEIQKRIHSIMITGSQSRPTLWAAAPRDWCTWRGVWGPSPTKFEIQHFKWWHLRAFQDKIDHEI